MKKIIFILLTLGIMAFFAHSLQAQEPSTPTPQIKKNAVSFSFFGTSMAMGVVYERVLAKHYSLELGAGLVGIGVGVKYFFSAIKPEKVSFLIGLSGVLSPMINDTDLRIISGNYWLMYLPLGISYRSNKSFYMGVDIGPATTFMPNYNGHYLAVYGNLKLGVHF